MIGAGTFINPLIKIITVVAVLAASYFFIVKPVLDTTNNAFDEFGLDEFSKSFGDLPNQIQDNVDEAFDASNSDSQAKGLQRCIERAIEGGATPNRQAVNRCLERFG